MAIIKSFLDTVISRRARPHTLLVGCFLIYYLWVIGRGVTSSYKFELTSPYLVAPLSLIVGIFLGVFLRQQWLRAKAVYFFIALVTVTVLSLPIYANASAAVGGLTVALAGLGALDLREVTQPNLPEGGTYQGSSPEIQVLRQAIVLALAMVVGVLLVLDAQAATILIIPVFLVSMVAVWKHNGPPQWLTISLGFFVAAGAMLTVIFLGGRPTWPDWLADSESLSSARHTLWSDALSLWATEPLVGAGPGSFTPSSELASSVPSLAAVHSLPLQVGAELGIVGVVLLAGLFLAGMLFAARGSRPVAFIAIAAWTALGVHSSIDHLEDFPIVAFMGGVVLGWSGFRSNPSDVPRRTENTVR
jgi:hypothetical protein